MVHTMIEVNKIVFTKTLTKSFNFVENLQNLHAGDNLIEKVCLIAANWPWKFV